MCLNYYHHYDLFFFFFLFFWGGYDLHVNTLPFIAEKNETLRCCGPNGEVLQYMADKDCMPIILSSADTRFRGNCMEFTRSLAAHSASGSKMSKSATTHAHRKVNRLVSYLIFNHLDMLVSLLVFEPNQALRIISALKTKFSPSLSYSSHRSINVTHNFFYDIIKIFHIKITTTLCQNISHKLYYNASHI